MFAVPLDRGQYLLYAPARGSATVGNAALVNLLVALRDGRDVSGADPDGGFRELFSGLGLLETSSFPGDRFGDDSTDAARCTSRGDVTEFVAVSDRAGSLDRLSSNAFADRALASIEPTLDALERDAKEYSLWLSLPIQHPRAFAAVISRVCAKHEPRGAIIEAVCGGRSDCDEPPREVRALVDALRAVRSRCEIARCEIVPAGARVAPSHCDGCFARQHCLMLGPSDDTAHEIEHVAGSIQCHVVRELIKDSVLARIAASGGLALNERGSR